MAYAFCNIKVFEVVRIQSIVVTPVSRGTGLGQKAVKKQSNSSFLNYNQLFIELSSYQFSLLQGEPKL